MGNLNVSSGDVARSLKLQGRELNLHNVRVTLPNVDSVVLSRVTAANIQVSKVRLYPISYLLDALPPR